MYLKKGNFAIFFLSNYKYIWCVSEISERYKKHVRKSMTEKAWQKNHDRKIMT